MKRPMKWITTLTVMLFAVGVISSCSQKETDDAATTDEATPVAEATPAAETTDTAGMDSMDTEHPEGEPMDDGDNADDST